MSRTPLKAGEYWCLYPAAGSDDPPVLLLKPGPHFEHNAVKAMRRIAIVRLVVVREERPR